MGVVGSSFEYTYTASVSAATASIGKGLGIKTVFMAEPVVGTCAVVTGVLLTGAAGQQMGKMVAKAL